MKPLKNTEAFVNALNKTHGKYTCIVLYNLESLSQNLISVIWNNLKKRNIFEDFVGVHIYCADSFDSSSYYYVSNDLCHDENLESTVSDVIKAIPYDAEFVFFELIFSHFHIFKRRESMERIRLVMYQPS